MTRQKSTVRKTRRKHSEEFKAEALAAEIRVHEAAEQLKLQPSQLYLWRTQAERKHSRNEADAALSAEVARLKRQLVETELELSIANKAAAFVARNLS